MRWRTRARRSRGIIEPHGARRPPRSTRRATLRRLEAAPRARRLRPAPAEAAAARRADRRRRCQGAPRVLGPDPRHGRRRADRRWSRPITWTRPSAASASSILPTGASSCRARATDVPAIRASSPSRRPAAMWTPRRDAAAHARRRGGGRVRPRAARRRHRPRARSRARIRSGGGDALSWQEVEPRLEDVFIHMLSVKGEVS